MTYNNNKYSLINTNNEYIKFRILDRVDNNIKDCYKKEKDIYKILFKFIREKSNIKWNDFFSLPKETGCEKAPFPIKGFNVKDSNINYFSSRLNDKWRVIWHRLNDICIINFISNHYN